MPWLKLVHVTAVICWCGALLYLQAAIAAGGARLPAIANTQGRQIFRGIFVGVATPAALLAIASGTTIFLLQGPLVPWLIVKLALVGLLVLGHAACGMLVLRIERHDSGHVGLPAWAIGISSLLWISAIAWLVLQKPVL